jgi:hypothetical protein
VAEIPVKRPLLLKTTLEVLRDSGAKLSRSQLSGEVSRRLDLTAYELAAPEGGSSRYNHAFGRLSSGVAKVGWVSKLGGWSITDAGIEALNAFPDEKELNNALDPRDKEVDESRKQAYELLSPASQFIAATLELVARGSWTAPRLLHRPRPAVRPPGLRPWQLRTRPPRSPPVRH